MTGLKKLHCVAAIVFVVLFVSSSPVLSARQLNGYRSENLAATEHGLDPFLYGGDTDTTVDDASSTKNHNASPKNIFPFELEYMGSSATELELSPPSQEFKSAPHKLVGRSSDPLLFTMLPKGNLPPSGPSGRTNNVNN